MAKFDVIIKGSKLEVVKVQEDNTATKKGFDYVKTITAPTKSIALKQAQNQVSSGKIKTPKQILNAKWKEEAKARKAENKIRKELSQPEVILKEKPLPSVDSHETKKAIFLDFNGVIDDPKKYGTVSWNEPDEFRVPKLADPHKLMKVLKLAIKHNAEIVMTSLFRTSGLDYYIVMNRAFKTSGIKEYVNFCNENSKIIRKLTNVLPTNVLQNRTDEVRKSIHDMKYTHFVVFEDDHQIDKDLNPIMVNSLIGMTDEHIEKADKILGG